MKLIISNTPTCDASANAIFLTETHTSAEYVVVVCKNPSNVAIPVIMDAKTFDHANTWAIHQTGYATQGSTYLHRIILPDNTNNLTVDHVNWMKNDNRQANLRYATQSEQNMNRTTRSDKLDPHECIMKYGIPRLPRYMRWDLTEFKFLIELPKTKFISGTKAGGVTIINKFRDALVKYIDRAGNRFTKHFIEDRIKLADEYNQIIKFAHMAAPEIIPNGPYAEIDDMCDEVSYCRYCLDKLPDVQPGEILHGVLNVVSQFVVVPDINAFGIEKYCKGERFRIIFDDKFKNKVERLPAIDFSSGSPIIPATHDLRALFPQIVNEYDVTKKKKFLVKELVWRGFFNNPPLEDNTTIVPFNGQALDLREENLRVLPGAAKEHKSLEDLPEVPDDVDIPFNFWPRGVFLLKSSASAKNPWTLYVKLPTKPRKTFLVGPATITETFANRVMPLLLENYPNFEENNTLYQRLLSDYVVYVLTD